jgi:hypothetical protein
LQFCRRHRFDSWDRLTRAVRQGNLCSVPLCPSIAAGNFGIERSVHVTVRRWHIHTHVSVWVLLSCYTNTQRIPMWQKKFGRKCRRTTVATLWFARLPIGFLKSVRLQCQVYLHKHDFYLSTVSSLYWFIEFAEELCMIWIL